MQELTDARAAVRALVDAAGLPVTEDEFQTFVAMYPALRAAADSLYTEDARYQDPVTVFAPKPPKRP